MVDPQGVHDNLKRALFSTVTAGFPRFCHSKAVYWLFGGLEVPYGGKGDSSLFRESDV